jgi:hypothetical protein
MFTRKPGRFCGGSPTATNEGLSFASVSITVLRDRQKNHAIQETQAEAIPRELCSQGCRPRHDWDSTAHPRRAGRETKAEERKTQANPKQAPRELD